MYCKRLHTNIALTTLQPAYCLVITLKGRYFNLLLPEFLQKVPNRKCHKPSTIKPSTSNRLLDLMVNLISSLIAF